MSEKPEFRAWCIVEMMGHQRMAGFVTEEQIAGVGMLRVDVPETPQRPAFTRYLSPTSLYALNPTTEENARVAATHFQVAPLREWEMRHAAALPATTAAAEQHDDDGDSGMDEDEIPY